MARRAVKALAAPEAKRLRASAIPSILAATGPVVVESSPMGVVEVVRLAHRQTAGLEPRAVLVVPQAVAMVAVVVEVPPMG
jgi:hypothetical protein